MPSRWWVITPEIDPELVKLEHLHGAVSALFDIAGPHDAPTKAYAVSPMGERDGTVGFEIGLYSAEAEQRWREVTATPTRLRFGSRFTSLGGGECLTYASWPELAARVHDNRWRVDFRTPTTFRRGNRSTCLPDPASILRGVARNWLAYSEVAITPPLDEHYRSMWVSHISGQSSSVAIDKVTYAGFVGTVTYRCADAGAAAILGPLFALAPYCGIGSATARGLGVVDVEASGRGRAR